MSAQGNGKLRDRLIGTWRLVSAMREEIPSGAKTPFLGENPTGFLHYMPEGRMLALITRAGRKAPVGKVANAAEAEALIRSMISLWRHLRVRRQRGHPPLRHFLEPELHRHGAAAQRDLRGRAHDPLAATLARSDRRHMSVRRLTWERV